MRNIICTEDRTCKLEPMAQTGGSTGLIATEEDYVIPLIAKGKVVKKRQQRGKGRSPTKKVQKGRGRPSTLSRKKVLKRTTPKKKKKTPWTI